MKTEWTDGAISTVGHFRDTVIDTVGENGCHFAGPHDANVEDVVIIDAGQNADNTYNGLLIGSGGGASGGNGRFYNIHIWHRAGIANRCAYGLSSGGINEFVSCHFEGCRVNAAFRTIDIVNACRIYKVFGPTRSKESSSAFKSWRLQFRRFSNDAGATAGGVPINGLYRDSSSGAGNSGYLMAINSERVACTSYHSPSAP